MKLNKVNLYSIMMGWILSMSLYADIPLSRDPTAPGYSIDTPTTQKTVQKPNYVVQSILVDGSRRIALINDKFVSEGDMVNNAKIIAIHTNSVDLMESGQKVTVYLFDTMQE